MDIEKLIEQLRTESLYADKASLEIMDLCMAAAAALSTLQAENEKLRADVVRFNDLLASYQNVLVPELRAELGYEKEHANAYYEECGQWEAENKKLRAELEQVKADSTEPCREKKRTCTPKWRGTKKDSSPYLIADEATEFTRDQWDWLMGRLMKKED